MCSRLLLLHITTSGFVRHLKNVQSNVLYTPAYIILPFSVSNVQKCHICEVYIFASQAYNAGSRTMSHVDVTSEPAS